MRNAFFTRVSVCLTLLLSFIASVTFADQFDHLTPRISGVSTTLRAVAFGFGQYVAVGDGGTILTSPDTLAWTPQLTPTNSNLRGITFAGGLLVAVGNGGTILTSTNGTAWTARISGTTNGLRALGHGGGNFVAVGDAGTILVSSNGTSWSASSAGVTNALNGVAYGVADVEIASFKFVVVGDSGTILTSSNGLAWTLRSSGTLLGLNSVALGDNPSGIDVAVGQSGVVVTSPDTVTWTVQFSGTTSNLNAVAVDPIGYYSGPVLRNGPLGTFGAAGDGGTFITSSDGGNNWTAQPTETTNDLRGVTFETGGFLAVGDMGTVQAGFIWVQRASGVADTLLSIVWGSDRFVAVGGSGLVVTSTNGSNWQAGNSGITGTISQVIFDGKRFVAIAGGGVVLISTNALNWSSKIASAGSNFTSIAYGNGLYVATGPGGGPPGTQSSTFVSSNGTDWLQKAAIPITPGDLAFGAGLFCALGAGAILTSPDGVHWTSQNPGTTSQLAGGAYVNGMFLVAGQGVMLTSPDGTNWTSHPTGYLSTITCSGHNAYVGAGGLTFVGQNLGNGFLTSSDGITWTSRGPASVSELPLSLHEAAFGAGTFVAVGDGGLIFQSVPAPPLLTIRPIAQGMEIGLTGDIGRNLALEAAPALGQPWTNLTTFSNVPFRTNYTDSLTNAPQRFYRTREF